MEEEVYFLNGEPAPDELARLIRALTDQWIIGNTGYIPDSPECEEKKNEDSSRCSSCEE